MTCTAATLPAQLDDRYTDRAPWMQTAREDDGGPVSLSSPRVTELSWGSVTTEAGTFRDAKLWPGGGRGWDWNETGTHHSPGIQVTDVKELLAHDPEVVILSRGQQRRLQVPQETIDALEQAGVDVEVLESSAAVDRYNELVAVGRRVGALIHSTC